MKSPATAETFALALSLLQIMKCALGRACLLADYRQARRR